MQPTIDYRDSEAVLRLLDHTTQAYRADRLIVNEMPEALNESYNLVLVVGSVDDSSERIITYLAEEYGVSITAVFFRFFRDGASDYLSCARRAASKGRSYASSATAAASSRIVPLITSCSGLHYCTPSIRDRSLIPEV